MAIRYVPSDIEKIFRTLDDETDRAAISVASSLVEYALEKVIETRLRDANSKTEANLIFNDNGLFGTFSQKILGAYFLKIIGPEARRELDLIRNIRNQAAHDMNPISFVKTTEIAARCRDLRFGKDAMADGKSPSDLRRRFLVVASFFAANLLMRASKRDAKIIPFSYYVAPSLDR